MTTAPPAAAPPAALPLDGLPPDAIDPVAFARHRGRLEGRAPIAAFGRLRDADVAADGFLDWSVDGEFGPDDLGRQREFLRIRLRFAPSMTCVRCLEPVRIGPLDVDRRFRLAASERQAEIEDREAETVDVIAAAPRLDLAALVEDEAILALPMAPSHADCTAPAGQPLH